MSQGWIVVALHDDADIETERHVLPGTLAPEFNTTEEEDVFADQLDKEGWPISIGEDGRNYTYFGHMASAKCPCGPRIEPDAIFKIYVHRHHA